MDDFLKVRVLRGPRMVQVKKIDLTTVDVPKREKPGKKLLFTVEDSRDREFQISDVWTGGAVDKMQIQGLWWELIDDDKEAGHINPDSAVGRLLNHYNASTLDDMIGMKISVTPGPKRFLILVACDTDN